MAMTEKQGGSDRRANSTRAIRGDAGTWLLTGHKWFCSAPMSDAFLVLAQDKTVRGEGGAGVRTIIGMVARTRLDCIHGTAAGMRQAVAEALWQVRHRAVFGAKLIDQPAMTAVVADLAIERRRNGHIEEFPLARRYREQPAMAIWEGSGNVIALDVLKAMRREPASVEAIALSLQASLLVRHAPAEVSDAFVAARLGEDRGHEYGTLLPGTDLRAILGRH